MAPHLTQSQSQNLEDGLQTLQGVASCQIPPSSLTPLALLVAVHFLKCEFAERNPTRGFCTCCSICLEQPQVSRRLTPSLLPEVCFPPYLV